MNYLKLNSDQSQEIKAIRFGLINDDFLHERITALVYKSIPLNPGEECYPIKIYPSAYYDQPPVKFTGFDDQRILGGEYREIELDEVFKQQLTEYFATNGNQFND